MKIISGKYKNKKIYTLNNKKLKPTSSINKKILFEWINKYIINKKCIDCFAGTGSLSLEAISRKAKYTLIIEKNYKIANIIKKNFKDINKKKFKIKIKNSIKWLKKIKNIKYNIIFIDPPYKKKKYINKIINIIEKNNIIKKKSLIYIETQKQNNIYNIPSNWILYKKKIIHSTIMMLYKKIN